MEYGRSSWKQTIGCPRGNFVEALRDMQVKFRIVDGLKMMCLMMTAKQ